MRNNIYIDGIDVRDRFGCRVTRGGYDGLLAFPSMKEPERNDWPEEDGIEADLSDPKVEPMEASVSFLADTQTGATDLIAYLSGPGCHRVHIPSLGREWQLRLSDHAAYRAYPAAASFTLKWIEDVPRRPQATECDPGLWVPQGRYRMDGVPLSAYGVVVDEGHNALTKQPPAKVNMQRKIASIDGQLYDAGHLVLRHKEVTFKCHLKAASMEAFWGCRDRFFAALSAPGERMLQVADTGGRFPCYYRKTSGWKLFTMCGMVVVRFDLTLVFTSFRLYETDYFLATEEGDFIITEDGVFFIDMK